MSRGKRKPLSKLGKELAKLRIDAEESRADMAKRLGMSEPTLTKLEVGESLATAKFLSDIAKQYELDEVADERLRHAATVSQRVFTLVPASACADVARQVLAVIEDRLDDISESEWLEIEGIAGGGGAEA